MNSVVLSILGVSALLAAISIVVPVARRLRLPYTVVLAFLGGIVGLLGFLNIGLPGFSGNIINGLKELGLLDDAFVYIYLPPLLFSSGLNVDIRLIFDDIWHIAMLAVVAVVVCTVFVGYGLNTATGMGLLPCLLLGTIVSTTDTAAVINIFRESAVPKRLSAIVEGEALFNDAAAIAMFGLFLSILSRGMDVDILDAGREFLLALIGGAAVGYVIARVCCGIISILKDAVTTEVTLTLASAYLSFVIGNDLLGVSGVVATVTLAVVIGANARTRVSPGSWESLNRVWEHLDFWATSLIFVTSAMYIPRALKSFDLRDLANVIVIFLTALSSRFLIIWGAMPAFSALGASKPLDRKYKFVLWWGGMRGAVTIALALTASASDGLSEPVRHFLTSGAIGYVIASLTINGLTLRPVLSLLRLDRLSDHDRALRNRVRLLTRRRINRELQDVAVAIGRPTDDVNRAIVPILQLKSSPELPDNKLRTALETWCHHEMDVVLTFRERGVLRRRHADALRARAESRLSALKTGVADFRELAGSQRKIPYTFSMAFWVHRAIGWKLPVMIAIAEKLESLVAEALILRELLRQCEVEAKRIFGRIVAIEMSAQLVERKLAVDHEIEIIEKTYPRFSGAIHKRYVTLVALGLAQAEYGRLLSRRTISSDLFEELETQRAIAAANLAKRHQREFNQDIDMAVQALPGLNINDGLESSSIPYLAFPGHRIRLRPDSKYFVVVGQVEVTTRNDRIVLGPGKYFGQSSTDHECMPVDEAISLDYAHIRRVQIRQ